MAKKFDAVDVLFTGQLRTPELFKKSIKDFVSLKKEGLINQIIFANWDDDLNEQEGMKKFIEMNEISLIEGREKDKGYEYIWSQMKALEEGLKKVDNNRFVLKTRCDVYISKKFLKKLFIEKEKRLKITHDLPKGNLFEDKIWTIGYELTKPFNISESTFFGKRDDLNKLVNYEKSYDNARIGKGITHVRRFVHPFIRDYPFFNMALNLYKDESHVKSSLFLQLREFIKPEKFWILRKFAQYRRFSSLKKRLKNKNYLKMLAAYYYILYSHFNIGLGEKNDVLFRDKYQAAYTMKFDMKIMENNFKKSKIRKPHITEIYVHTDELINNLIECKMKSTPLTIQLRKFIKKFKEEGNFN